jgi:hypothetical protein
VDVLSIADDIATLNLEASDDNSGVYDMRLGEDIVFTGAVWQLYTDTVTTTWSSGGIVYVEFRDRAGNVSVPASTLDEYEIYLPLVLRE